MVYEISIEAQKSLDEHSGFLSDHLVYLETGTRGGSLHFLTDISHLG